MRRVVLLCVSLLLTLPVLAGIPGVDVAVQVSARGQAAPAAIILSWPLTPSAGMAYHAHTVYRKAAHDTTWGTPLATLAGTAAGFTDTHVTPGVGYEYQVIRDAEADGLTFHGYGYVYAGIGLAAVERRGTVLLLVDARQAAPLRAELAQLAQDLVGDGWQVRRHDIDPTLTDKQVKALIAADYHADPAHVTAVLLLGHVAVPYSGNIAPDGHPQPPGCVAGGHVLRRHDRHLDGHHGR